MAELLISAADGTLLLQRLIDPARAYWIGRSPKCDIVVHAASVSRRHVILYCHQGVWRVVDAGSQSGLKTEAGECRTAQLSAETWVKVGAAVLWIKHAEPANTVLTRAAPSKSNRVRLTEEDLAALDAPRDSLEIEAHEPPPARPTLIVTSATGGVELVVDLTATAGRLVIGSAATCDIVIADPSVELIHAVLVRGSNTWSLLDAGGGVFAAGKKWPRKRLDEETIAEVGNFSFVIRTPKIPSSTVPFVPPATVRTEASAFLEEDADGLDEHD
ncbi:MAG: FHA domain-containing protein [Phycisphaerales bacterium]|nr:FHA domain-containing protein [Phycisphaerales bacterium]